ncbi:unnamed protein product [Malus baccata var. baccata]
MLRQVFDKCVEFIALNSTAPKSSNRAVWCGLLRTAEIVTEISMTPFDHCVSLVEQQCIRRRGLEPRRPCTVSEDKYVSEAHTTIASEMLGGRLIESNQQNLVP